MQNSFDKDNKIKILRIIARLNIGGPAMQAVFLNKAFNNGIFSSKLVYGSIDDSEGDMSYLLGGDGARAIYIKEMAREVNLFKDLVSFFRILAIMLRERPHIVHTHTAKAGALGRIAAMLSGVPVRVHTLHGHIFEGYFDTKRTGLFRVIESFLAHYTDRLIILSPALRDEIKHNLRIKDDAKFALVPLGVESERFLRADSLKGQFKRELNLPDDARLIGIVGRLVPIKNHRMFIDAAKIILTGNGSRRNIKFVIVGDGEAKEDILMYARKNDVLGDMIFTGWRRDLERIYADLDVVSLCSINEGTPVSLIEAMLAARPVVATDVGGVRDIITHPKTGYLVPKGDAAGFAARILEVLDDTAGARMMGEAAREHANRIYFKDRLTNDMEVLYMDLLKRKGLVA